MLLKHSLSLTITNVQLVFKVLIYSFIIFVIGSAVFVTISEPVLQAIGASFNLNEIFAHFEEVMQGDGGVFERIVASVDHFAETHPQELVKSVVFSVILIIVVKFFFALIVCPVGYVINQKMSTKFEEGFIHSIVSVGWKSVGVSAIYTLISAPIDILIFAGAFFLGRWLSLIIGIFGVMFALTIGLLLITLRLSVMGQWVAVFINEKLKFSLQFKRGFRAGFNCLKKVYPVMLTLVVVIFGIIATTALPTFLIIPVVCVPFMLVCFTAIHLVTYYQENDKNYYSE
ncbi:MAG: hypothetical protein J6R44_03700 [Clostridia bacterium]|nr:hypothetical protein [Clostridia bacterium]MBO7178624.1 hypothetical protein [Clostridia bacterium]